ncbi:MAG: phenylalanine--tRNA ligase subunit beta, partial [Bacteroidales bacterium]|nr:phenylalanine--tRNA ligase subunit beta [Bacteroidales bacterium]
MKISYNWLKQYINFNLNPDDTARYLTDCGLEVEGIEQFETIKGGLRGLVVGEVLTCEPHPDSDHLHVTTVDVGGETPLNIVCGAANVAQGQKVIVATIGTVLYNGDESFTIKKSKLRGVVSEGMICAEDEIGVGTSHAGIMVLPPETKVGTPASKLFYVETDTIFEIGLTPNRSDAICHFGVARDLQAILKANGISCSAPILPLNHELRNTIKQGTIEVVVENKKDCPRYTGIT